MNAAPELGGLRKAVILAVDNGGTKTRMAQGGARLGRDTSYNTPRTYSHAIDKIAENASLVLGGKKPDAIGFSVAGSVREGRIVQAGQLDEYGWVGKPFAEDVSRATGVPAENIVLLNDCAAGANAERVARLEGVSDSVGLQLPKLPDIEVLALQDGEFGAFNVLSTGFGGGLYTATEILGDEPGHRYLKPGAICGDKQEGHIEAHVSGSGIERKFGIRGENIPHDDRRWKEIKGDFHEGVAITLAHHRSEDRAVKIIGFSGSVALRGPHMLEDLQTNLNTRLGDQAPAIAPAAFGENSGLYGASFAAAEVLHAGADAVVLK